VIVLGVFATIFAVTVMGMLAVIVIRSIRQGDDGSDRDPG
jgi:hypothetical protein